MIQDLIGTEPCEISLIYGFYEKQTMPMEDTVKPVNKDHIGCIQKWSLRGVAFVGSIHIWLGQMPLGLEFSQISPYAIKVASGITYYGNSKPLIEEKEEES